MREQKQQSKGKRQQYAGRKVGVLVAHLLDQIVHRNGRGLRTARNIAAYHQNNAKLAHGVGKR